MRRFKKLRARLTEQLVQLERRVSRIDSDLRRESNELDRDFEEQATVRQNDEVLDGLEREGREQIALVRAALDKIDAGTYGVCAKCGGEIAEERLEALPQAIHCIHCAS